MNLNIQQVKNGWIVTKYLTATISSTTSTGTITSYGTASIPSYPYQSQEQFVFSSFEEFFSWFRTNLVLEKLTQ